MRSEDFERIHIEFCSYYKDTAKGNSEYYSWIQALSLDESKPYGSARESFRWAKSMLHALKEDAENKYYGILVGLPLMSMNGNIYHERDLIAAALSLKGKHPSLNHKDEFWFNESNRYGVLTVEDAKYEDGAVEAVLRVPKTAVCPICNGDKMTELIDKQRIVNVSLEGRNNGAFEFSDPPFTLLTSDVLPGIPLARIKPLEQIVSEAFHGTYSTGKKRMIKATVKEDKNQNIDNDNSTVNTKTLTTDLRGTWGTPISTDAALHSNTMSSGNTTVPVGESPADKVFRQSEASADAPATTENPTDPSMQCPEGTQWNPATGTCEPCQECRTKEEAAPSSTIDAPKQGPPKTSPPDRAIPKAGSLPNCDDNTYWAGKAPVEPSVQMGTRPPLEMLPSLAERKAAIVANQKANTFEAKALEWEQKHDDVYTQLQQHIGANAALKQSNKSLEAYRDEAIRELRNKEVERDQWRQKYERELGLREEYKAQVETYKNEMSRLSEKYNDMLSKNLKLSQDNTKSNEDYLEIAQKLEKTEEALGRARNEAKRITRIQA
jgi:hypothetical protein